MKQLSKLHQFAVGTSLILAGATFGLGGIAAAEAAECSNRGNLDKRYCDADRFFQMAEPKHFGFFVHPR